MTKCLDIVHRSRQKKALGCCFIYTESNRGFSLPYTKCWWIS